MPCSMFSVDCILLLLLLLVKIINMGPGRESVLLQYADQFPCWLIWWKDFILEMNFFFLLTTSTCVTYTPYRFLTQRGKTKGKVVKVAGRRGGEGEPCLAPLYGPGSSGMPGRTVVWLAKSQFIRYDLLARSKSLEAIWQRLYTVLESSVQWFMLALVVHCFFSYLTQLSCTTLYLLPCVPEVSSIYHLISNARSVARSIIVH